MDVDPKAWALAAVVLYVVVQIYIRWQIHRDRARFPGMWSSPADNPDRRGFPRCAGYHQEDFRLCPKCPTPPSPANPMCEICGGYGEI